MIINFKNGYFVESGTNGWELKYDTGKIKKSLKRETPYVPIVKRIASSKTLEGIINILADYKIRKIDSEKVIVILNKIDTIKKELEEVLKSYKIEFKIKEPKNERSKNNTYS